MGVFPCSDARRRPWRIGLPHAYCRAPSRSRAIGAARPRFRERRRCHRHADRPPTPRQTGRRARGWHTGLRSAAAPPAARRRWGRCRPHERSGSGTEFTSPRSASRQRYSAWVSAAFDSVNAHGTRWRSAQSTTVYRSASRCTTAVAARQWSGDLKAPKQAECLVHRHVPWSLIERVGVVSQCVANRVSEIVGGTAGVRVEVCRRWYY